MRQVDNKESQKFFDHLAPKYDAQRNQGFLNAAEAAVEFYMQKFPSQGRGAMLEIGVGTGEAFSIFAQRYDLAVAFDISHEMVGVARSKAAGKAKFCVASAEALPFPNRSFDAVLCMDVLEHVSAPASAVREISRVLAVGGVAYVTTPNPLWAPIQWTAEKLKLKVPEGPHRYVFLPDLISQLATTDHCLTIHHLGFLVYAPLGDLARPQAGWTLSQKPILKHFGHNQLAVLRKHDQAQASQTEAG